MRFYLVILILFSVFPLHAQIRPTAGPFGGSGDQELYMFPYNRMTTMDEKFGYLSTVLAERLSSCGFRVNPASNDDLVATYYQIKFRRITESNLEQCRMTECLESKELTYIMGDLYIDSESVPYLMKSYKIEKIIAEDMLKTFHQIDKNPN